MVRRGFPLSQLLPGAAHTFHSITFPAISKTCGRSDSKWTGFGLRSHFPRNSHPQGPALAWSPNPRVPPPRHPQTPGTGHGESKHRGCPGAHPNGRCEQLRNRPSTTAQACSCWPSTNPSKSGVWDGLMDSDSRPPQEELGACQRSPHPEPASALGCSSGLSAPQGCLSSRWVQSLRHLEPWLPVPTSCRPAPGTRGETRSSKRRTLGPPSTEAISLAGFKPVAPKQHRAIGYVRLQGTRALAGISREPLQV